MIKGLLSRVVAICLLPLVASAGIIFTATDATTRINLPTAAQLNITGNFTLMAWIKTTDVNPRFAIVGYQASPPTFLGYALGVSNKINLFTGGATLKNTFGITTVNDGAWHHIAATLTGTNVAFYLDGVADGTTNSPVPSSFSGPRYLGGDTGATFNGAFAGCAIFDKALPATAINLIAKSHIVTQPLAWTPVGYWHLINVPDGTPCTNQIFLDISGNNLHGVGFGASCLSAAEVVLTYP